MAITAVRVTQPLTPEQADGCACIFCGAVNGAQVPVGRSVAGSQVFACTACAESGEVIS